MFNEFAGRLSSNPQEVTMEVANDNYEQGDVPFPEEHLTTMLDYWRHTYAPELSLEECQWRVLPRFRQIKLPPDDMLQCLILAMEWQGRQNSQAPNQTSL